MRRGLLLYALLLLAVATLATGCYVKKEKNVYNQDELDSKFPGADVVKSNLAVDGAALSPNHANIVGLPRMFYSDSGKAIMLYTARSVDDAYGFYASYFNGKKFKPAVEIKPVGLTGKMGDLYEPVDVDKCVVMFYAPGKDPDNRLGKYDGDAVILFSRYDVDDGGPDDEPENERLWWCYFDSSKSGSEKNSYGFGTFTTPDALTNNFDFRPGYADVLDSDDSSGNPGSNPNNDNVLTYGVVSDGTRGAAYFNTSGSYFDQHDFSEYLAAVWIQEDAYSTSRVDNKVYYRRLDMTAEPPTWSTTTEIMPSWLDTGDGSEAKTELLTYNQSLWCVYVNRIYTININDDDECLAWTMLGSSTSGGPAGFANGVFIEPLEVSPHFTYDNNDADCSFRQIAFGEDEGSIDHVMPFYYRRHGGYDMGLYAAHFQIRCATPFTRSTDQDQIDTASDSVAYSDWDYDLQARVNTTGEFVTFAWRQDSASSGTDYELYANTYATRTLLWYEEYVKTSGLTVPAERDIDTALATTTMVSEDVDSDTGVTSFAFQREAGWRFDESKKGIEGGPTGLDNKAMYLVYEQYHDDMGATDYARDDLYVARIYQGVSSFTSQTTLVDSLEEGAIEDPEDLYNRVWALPDATGKLYNKKNDLAEYLADGLVIYYTIDTSDDGIINETDDEDVNYRLCAKRYAGTSNTLSTRVDLSTPLWDNMSDAQQLRVYPWSGIRVFSAGSKYKPEGQYHMIFFLEERDSANHEEDEDNFSKGSFLTSVPLGSTFALKFRRYSQHVKDASGDEVSFEGSVDLTNPEKPKYFSKFDPPVFALSPGVYNAYPQIIDTGEQAHVYDSYYCVADGSNPNVAVYFWQGGHIWYNEYKNGGTKWKDAFDMLVDNDMASNVGGYLAGGGFTAEDFYVTGRSLKEYADPRYPAVAGKKKRSVVFWAKTFEEYSTTGSSYEERRAFIRVHK